MSLNERCELSLVVPCYNEEETLETLLERSLAVCRNFGKSFEILLVNDGSRDKTWEIMRDAVGRIPELVVVNLSRNHGHQLALTAGLQLSRGERVLILDADLQDPPELLPEMWSRMDAGADVVYGQRRQREKESWFKKFTAYIFYRLLNSLSDISIPKDVGDFRLISRRALNVLLSMPEQNRFIRGMVSWIGFKQEAILYDRSARYAGVTKYPIKKMVRFALDAITSFSVRPLRIAVYSAMLFGVLALMMISYVLYGMTTRNYVSGWASVMAVLLIGFSFLSFQLGLLGEYVGRIFLESKRRPLYVVSEVLRGKSSLKTSD